MRAAGTGSGRTSMPEQGAGAGGPAPDRRAEVRKTYKLYIRGGFPRSESGRSYAVSDAHGRFLANAALASRKDARDAVAAARQAVAGWSGTTAYNRGQVLYRVAEMLAQRSDELAGAVTAAEGLSEDRAAREVAAAVDRLVWYAGWADKVAQVLGSANPVAGPYFNFSVPEPAGVVAVLAPQGSSLLGLVSAVAPVIVTGNTAVVVASQARPLPAISFGEVTAHADLPAGVVNVLSGRLGELAPVLASHRDVDGLDLTGAAAAGIGAGATGDGVPGPAELATELGRAAATNVKRVLAAHRDGEPDWHEAPGTKRLFAFLEIKTVWHPVGV